MHVGFDVGGTNLRFGLYNDQWVLVEERKVRLRGTTSPEGVVAEMMGCLAPHLDSVDAVGVGFAGQLDASAQVVKNAPNFGWRDVPLAQMLLSSVQRPVRLVNDLNALLWGEYIAGVAQNTQDALAVYVGTGIGGAIISSGMLIEGARGVAGELGHVKVQIGGRLCGCGEHGCLEAYAGGVHLERQVAQLAQGLPPDQLWGEEVLGTDGLHADLSRADDLSSSVEVLDELWRTTSSMLATSVANACTLLNPQMLVLGGGVLTHCSRWRSLFLSALTPRVLAVARDGLVVEFGAREDAGMLGAAALASELASSPSKVPGSF